jgi:hypothetical protein
LDHKSGELVAEIFMVGQILEELVEEKSETCTMDGRRHSKPSNPNWKSWCFMDCKHNKCPPIVEWRQLGWLCCGAQSVNQKIQLHPKFD